MVHVTPPGGCSQRALRPWAWVPATGTCSYSVLSGFIAPSSRPARPAVGKAPGSVLGAREVGRRGGGPGGSRTQARLPGSLAQPVWHSHWTNRPILIGAPQGNACVLLTAGSLFLLCISMCRKRVYHLTGASELPAHILLQQPVLEPDPDLNSGIVCANFWEL